MKVIFQSSEEHENLTEQEMNAKVAELEAKYDLSARICEDSDDRRRTKNRRP